jgi:hypothetical protein
LKARSFASLDEQQRFLERWEATVADTRIHGTTKRQVGKVFQEVPRASLAAFQGSSANLMTSVLVLRQNPKFG